MEEFTALDQRATGVFVTKIDITAGQTDAADLEIKKLVIQTRNDDQKQLAVRLTAGRTITRALRHKLDNLKQMENMERKRREISLYEIDSVAKSSKDKFNLIQSHARVARLEKLLELSQVKSVLYIERLQ